MIAISPFAEELRATFGAGQRWGMRLDYVLTQGEEDPEMIVDRLRLRLGEELLLLRGDVLHGENLAEFLGEAGDQARPIAYGKASGSAGQPVSASGGGRGGLEPLRWAEESAAAALVWPTVELLMRPATGWSRCAPFIRPILTPPLAGFRM